MHFLLLGVLVALAVAAETKTAPRMRDAEKKQDQQFNFQYGGGEVNPFEGMGDDVSGSIDFICDNFCPKPEQNNSHSEALMAEILKLKEQVTAQTTILAELQLALSSGGNSGPTTTSLVPVEYRPAYPIFHVQSDFGRYRYTLDQARSACDDNGGKLASYKQMLAAWERGLDLCQCGWIEEGYAVYPVQYPREGCSTKTGPGIRYNCDWQSTWNAWCFNKDVANKLP